MNDGELEGGIIRCNCSVSTSNNLHTYAAACWLFVCSCIVSSGSIAVSAVKDSESARRKRKRKRKSKRREERRGERRGGGSIPYCDGKWSGDGLGIYHLGGSRGVGFIYGQRIRVVGILGRRWDDDNNGDACCRRSTTTTSQVLLLVLVVVHLPLLVWGATHGITVYYITLQLCLIVVSALSALLLLLLLVCCGEREREREREKGIRRSGVLCLG